MDAVKKELKTVPCRNYIYEVKIAKGKENNEKIISKELRVGVRKMLKSIHENNL